ncbi:MAG: hypothetical protein ABSH00_10320 [Bryobacteraceae bacterium]|jgi:hypothetical protein
MLSDTARAQMLRLVSIGVLSLAFPALGSKAPSDWTTFTSMAGWTIKYPPAWQVGSCNSCRDPHAADVFVSFFDPATGGTIMIKRLKNKPADQSVARWLNDVKQVAVVNPRVMERWITLDGARALRVETRNPDSTESENIYIVDGSRTFFIQASPIQNMSFYRLYARMLSTLRFANR